STGGCSAPTTSAATTGRPAWRPASSGTCRASARPRPGTSPCRTTATRSPGGTSASTTCRTEPRTTPAAGLPQARARPRNLSSRDRARSGTQSSPPRDLPPMLVLRAVVVCLLVSVVRAQTAVHVVAPVAGPGVDFTSISAAVAAAADGDTTLVRSGNYPAFG